MAYRTEHGRPSSPKCVRKSRMAYLDVDKMILVGIGKGPNGIPE